MSKFIFLDVDGVLNYVGITEKAPGGVTGIDDECVKNIQKVVEATGAEIVISSSWRMGNYCSTKSSAFEDWMYLVEKFRRVGIHIEEYTPSLKGNIRGEEIACWLKRHKELDASYVIIDDDVFDIVDYHPGQIVKTSFMSGGFTKNKIQQAIDILNKGDK